MDSETNGRHFLSSLIHSLISGKNSIDTRESQQEVHPMKRPRSKRGIESIP
jgi:hypothetical protein